MNEWACVMRRCAFKNGGSLSLWPTWNLRCYTSEHCVADDRAQRLDGQLAKTVAVENKYQTLQTSIEHGKGATNHHDSSARYPLPLSPLMDPAYLAAKQKHHLQKAAPSKEPTPFQQKLAKNPYARALGTPVRQCRLTRTNLPSFFLQDFELINHPSTNEAWYLPRSLTSPYSHSSTADTGPSSRRVSPRSYLLSRASLLQAIKTHNSGFQDGENHFAPLRNDQKKAIRTTKGQWRADMDTFVLELMRRRIAEALRYLCGRKKGYLIPCENWEYAKGCKQIGAFLWLGPRHGEKGAYVGDEEGLMEKTTGSVSPGAFATLDITTGQEKNQALAKDRAANSSNRRYQGWLCWRCKSKEHLSSDCPEWLATPEGKRWSLENPKEITVEEEAAENEGPIISTEGTGFKNKIPLHNLQLLLGSDHVENLRRELPSIFNQEIVALKNRRTTIDVQLRLWKLQGYSAEHKQIDELE